MRNGIAGLSPKAAEEKLKQEGYNELPRKTGYSFFSILRGVVSEPMVFLLLSCGGLYFFIGDLHEAFILIISVIGIIGITLFQEIKTEKALEALKGLASPRALVVRGGKEIRIPGREVVREDIIVLAEGDRIPADAVLTSSSHLMVDESLLTGESVPVRKVSKSDNKDMGVSKVFSGTMVISGHGIAKVYATGPATEIGKIGAALKDAEQSESPIRQETKRLVRIVALAGFVFCLFVFFWFGAVRGDWLSGLLSGLTLAMGILPEEFPVVLTIFLALGAWRISKKKALVRRFAAIETLGAVDVLCVDKTGTLTENRMVVASLSAAGTHLEIRPQDRKPLPERLRELVAFGMLASQDITFDPVEIAIKEYGTEAAVAELDKYKDWVLEKEYPLSDDLLALSHVWRIPGGGYIIAAKGAPEAIAELCRLSDDVRRDIDKDIERMAEKGLRVLGVAKAEGDRKSALPRSQREFDFSFMGLVGFADPLRKSVPAAVEEAYQAGIRIIMITGDNPGTAMNIARWAGLEMSSRALSGSEIEAMSDDALRRALASKSICARVMPVQKLRIVRALKAGGRVVAMTGDGVNDAPALKEADIGIAMGMRGTDVARESADIVLLDDNFETIIKSVATGRRIYNNIRKAMAYIISIHIPIACLAVVPVIMDWPLILFPVHIVFLELIVDPACSIAFENEPSEKGAMQNPPRGKNEKLFSSATFYASLFQGLVVFATVLCLYVASIFEGYPAEISRTLAFASLVLSNIGLILANRSWNSSFLASLSVRNNALWAVIAWTAAFLAVVIYTPYLGRLFRFGALDLRLMAACFLVAAANTTIVETVEAIKKRGVKVSLLTKTK